jgi:hypothetical protein
MRGKDYTSINKLDTVYRNPWRAEVQVNGTDGNQFHPLVEQDEILTAFVPDFARQTGFTYKNSQFDAYPCGKSKSVEMMNFYLYEKEMESKYKNHENVIYNTLYDGTINLETVLLAPAIGTKGHYYQIDKQLSPRLPRIVDHSQTPIPADPNVDDTWLGIEKYSGVTLQARERIMISFMYNQSDSNLTLFSHLDQGFIVPFVFVQRDSIMTDAQVSEILADLITAAQIRIPLLVVFVVLGIFLVAVGGCLIKRYRGLQREEGSYGELIKNKLIDERTYKDGLGNKRFSNNRIDGKANNTGMQRQTEHELDS